MLFKDLRKNDKKCQLEYFKNSDLNLIFAQKYGSCLLETFYIEEIISTYSYLI